ncbi:hypothetical protein L7F22_043348 [Adiantum nelumboides]|nr:hypothetical protein [Adiantum nelumboides]
MTTEQNEQEKLKDKANHKQVCSTVQGVSAIDAFEMQEDLVTQEKIMTIKPREKEKLKGKENLQVAKLEDYINGPKLDILSHIINVSKVPNCSATVSSSSLGNLVCTLLLCRHRKDLPLLQASPTALSKFPAVSEGPYCTPVVGSSYAGTTSSVNSPSNPAGLSILHGTLHQSSLGTSLSLHVSAMASELFPTGPHPHQA